MKPSEYTFETYVTTSSNRLARLATEKICAFPSTYNPLYVFGPSSVGKTHLLQAIAKEYKNRQKTALYVSGPQFCEELIKAIQTGTNVEFREKQHRVDVLLLDRLQYVAGKEATQEELYNIVEKRLLDHKQTVFAGNVHPSKIPILNPELSACLAGGLCIEIPTSDFEGKTQIISQKLKAHGIDWPMEACRYVALNVFSGVNQIEGEINRIIACKELF